MWLVEKKKEAQVQLKIFNNRHIFSKIILLFNVFKIWFGRVISECTNDIRREAMTRINDKYFKKLDGEKPNDDYIKMYLDYYSMDLDTFNSVLDNG